MKKLLSLVLLLACSAVSYAQNEVTQFLGIPVDGSKSEMIQKLKAKGFRYDSELDCLKGEFNGRDSYISVVTNNNKVYRIMVRDVTSSSESDIRIRFNTLCRQFENNKKYQSLSSESYIIPEDENISYEMSVNKKRYQASYFQIPEGGIDSTTIMKETQSFIFSKYSQEQLSSLTEEQTQELMTEVLLYMTEKFYNRSVWFMIDEMYGDYYILLYYDNGYNQADGEDL
ncbi:hypothetical protein [Barnesiella intestinihominis]|jgi:hypothetical protein|uniref:hypothetical protein n=1 Tax=Barnesiella intestinihominis TaxID=487174 RepID=UPI0026716B1E|nr:hypothetical protein [Barnesiella intestinihominis]